MRLSVATKSKIKFALKHLRSKYFIRVSVFHSGAISLAVRRISLKKHRQCRCFFYHAERDFPHTTVCYRLAFARYPRALQPFAERLQFATRQTALVRIPYIKRKSKSQPKGYNLLFGTLKGIRTPDPLLRRQMLYPTELSAHKLPLATTHCIISHKV